MYAFLGMGPGDGFWGWDLVVGRGDGSGRAQAIGPSDGSEGDPELLNGPVQTSQKFVSRVLRSLCPGFSEGSVQGSEKFGFY